MTLSPTWRTPRQQHPPTKSLSFLGGGISHVALTIVTLLAILIGFIGTYKPTHFMALPFPLSFLLWMNFGEYISPYVFLDAWKDEEIPTWTKNGDLIVSVGPKSGTTWMLYCTHQIRMKGAPDSDELIHDVNEGMPWMDLRQSRHGSWQEQKERWNTTILPDGSNLKDRWDNPRYPFRIFRSHFNPRPENHEKGLDGAVLPINQHPEIKFLAMVRNGLDVVNSMIPFFASHSNAFRAVFGGIPPAAPTDVTSAGKLMKAMLPGGYLQDSYFSYVKNWWKVKDKPNVLLLHYSDARKDPKGTVMKLAHFLEVNLTQDQVDTVTQKCSMDYMKQRDHLFLLTLPLNQDYFWDNEKDRIMSPGSMIRTGRFRTNDKDQSVKYPFSDEQIERWKKGEEDEFGSIDNLLRWARYGGPFE